MNLHRNSEGYQDPTAYPTFREETEQENELNRLIATLRYIISHSEFELTDRIVLRHKKTGRVFR
jgi:hypothetical protein